MEIDRAILDHVIIEIKDGSRSAFLKFSDGKITAHSRRKGHGKEFEINDSILLDLVETLREDFFEIKRR